MAEFGPLLGLQGIAGQGCIAIHDKTLHGTARDCPVRPEGANHQWRRMPPGELSIAPVADERLGWVTGRAGAS